MTPRGDSHTASLKRRREVIAEQLLTALLAVGLVLTARGTASASAGPPPEEDVWFGAKASERSIVLVGTHSMQLPDGKPASNNADRYLHSRIAQKFCGAEDSGRSSVPCVDDAPSGSIIRLCPDGTPALDPLFRRLLNADGQPEGPWEQVDDGGCPEDPEPVVVLSVQDFRELPLVASGPSFQPADGQALVNLDLIVFTDPAPQELSTTVLGVPVRVRATPTSYSWDFGDGSAPVTTAEPGSPWPDYTVGHPYRATGAFEIQLRTTWAGQYQVNGAGPWLPVAGTAETASAPFTVTVDDAPAHLVARTAP